MGSTNHEMKISLKTLFIIVLLVAIAILGYYTYQLKALNKTNSVQIAYLKTQIENNEQNTILLQNETDKSKVNNKNKGVEFVESIEESEGINKIVFDVYASKFDGDGENIEIVDSNSVNILEDIGDRDKHPAIFLDDSGYVYYNADYQYDSNTISYAPIYNHNGNRIKPNLIILQSPSAKNENLQLSYAKELGYIGNYNMRYIFICDSEIYYMDNYFDEETNKLLFNNYAESRYTNIKDIKYTLDIVYDTYGGHTYDAKILFDSKNLFIVKDPMIVYDVKRGEDIINKKQEELAKY